jgi:hypothetical protein
MTKMTITEALAEIKTINARIGKKREAVMRYFARDAKLRDPMEADGGSKEFVRRERQAVHDLEERIVRIRTAIQTANISNSLQVGETSRSVSAWLNWRRDVSAGQKGFLGQLAGGLTQVRQNAVRQGMTVTDKDNYAPGDVAIMVNEQELSREIEALEGVLGSLDGKLSLFNAVTTVEV